MNHLREAAEGLLAWQSDQRECNRRGVTLAHLVLAQFPAEKAPEKPKKAAEPAKAPEKAEKPAKTVKKVVFRKKRS